MALRRDLQKNKRGRNHPDFVLTILIALLVVFGMIMISSASAVLSRVSTGDANSWFFSQMWSVLIGLFLLIFGYIMDYRFWRKAAPYLLVINIILLILVFVPGIGVRANGANRWVDLGMNFQPSEMMKLTLTLYLAAWFENKGKEVKSLISSTLPFLLIIGLIGFLVMKQPDMGTTTILALIGGTIYFVAGARILHVAAMVMTAAAFAGILIRSASYRMQRFMIFLNPESDSGKTGYHINQALLAIGSGGFFGLGFGRSRQKFSYLPEAATDSIFAVTAEELGILGAFFVVALFSLFAFRGYRISRTAPDVFARLVAVGVTTWIVGQAFINIMAILSLMPLTGVPLPFISYGGSSIITLMLACGILLNISKHTVKGEGNANRRFGRWHWRTYLPGFSRN